MCSQRLRIVELRGRAEELTRRAHGVARRWVFLQYFITVLGLSMNNDLIMEAEKIAHGFITANAPVLRLFSNPTGARVVV